MTRLHAFLELKPFYDSSELNIISKAELNYSKAVTCVYSAQCRHALWKKAMCFQDKYGCRGRSRGPAVRGHASSQRGSGVTVTFHSQPRGSRLVEQRSVQPACTIFFLRHLSYIYQQTVGVHADAPSYATCKTWLERGPACSSAAPLGLTYNEGGPTVKRALARAQAPRAAALTSTDARLWHAAQQTRFECVKRAHSRT